MLAHVLVALRGSRVRQVTVALREGDDEAAALVARDGAAIAWVEGAAETRSASIHAGVGAVRSDAEGILFAMADQPFLGASDFDALIGAFRDQPAGIVYARYAGQRSTPVLFASRYRAALLDLRGEEAGRVLIERHPDDAVGVDLDPERGRDLDRPEDLD